LKRFREGAESGKRIKLGRIINVMGSKGGVGTTTIAVNLATSLAEITAGKSVALVDMNIATGETPLFLDLHPGYHWGEISKNITRLDPTFIMNILSRHSSGIYLFASAGAPSNESISPEAVERLLNIMRRMFDFVVVDGGQLIDHISQKVLQISDTVLLIAILTLPCIANTKKIFKIYDYWGYPAKGKVKILVNRYLNNSQLTLKDAEATLERIVFWNLPNDFSTTLEAINRGKNLSAIAPRAEITKSFRKLALTFAGREQKPAKESTAFLKRWFS